MIKMTHKSRDELQTVIAAVRTGETLQFLLLYA
jgi:hypothetical protein